MSQLQELARLGASIRYAQLRTELQQLEQAFPGVGSVPPTGEANVRKTRAVSHDRPRAVRTRKRPPMSAEQRAKISQTLKERAAQRKLGR